MNKNKNLCLILLICLCVLLAACNAPAGVMDGTTQNTAGSTEPSREAEEKINGTEPELVEPDVGEIPLLTIENYDEYLTFLETAELPSDFVPYEVFAGLGTFKIFVCLSDSRQGDYSSYIYGLIDEDEREVALYVDNMKGKPVEMKTATITDVNEQDMRRLSTEESGTYIYSGVEYTYKKGELYRIAWQMGDIRLRLVGEEMLADCGLDTSTMLGKMLKLQTVAAATAEMTGKI